MAQLLQVNHSEVFPSDVTSLTWDVEWGAQPDEALLSTPELAAPLVDSPASRVLCRSDVFCPPKHDPNPPTKALFFVEDVTPTDVLEIVPVQPELGRGRRAARLTLAFVAAAVLLGVAGLSSMFLSQVGATKRQAMQSDVSVVGGSELPLPDLGETIPVTAKPSPVTPAPEKHIEHKRITVAGSGVACDVSELGAWCSVEDPTSKAEGFTDCKPGTSPVVGVERETVAACGDVLRIADSVEAGSVTSVGGYTCNAEETGFSCLRDDGTARFTVSRGGVTMSNGPAVEDDLISMRNRD